MPSPTTAIPPPQLTLKVESGGFHNKNATFVLWYMHCKWAGNGWLLRGYNARVKASTNHYQPNHETGKEPFT